MSNLGNKEIMAKNIKRFMQINDVSRNDICKDLGIKYTTFADWVNAKTYPRIDKIELLAKYFKVKKADLVEEPRQECSEEKTSRGVSIPVLGSVPAGIPLEAIEDIIDWEEIPKAWLNGDKEYFGLTVKGDSMYPKYIEGDTVIVRKEQDCESGQDCVVYVNGYDATLKKVVKKDDCLILQPLNPEYEPRMFDLTSATAPPVKIAGVVVELRRKV